MRGPRAADAVAAVRDRRRAGWSDEIAFWDHWLATRREPLAGLEQMVRVVKPGRWVLLKHVIDEGEHEGYVGLHDWNFRIEDGRFVIWNRESRIYPDERLPPAAGVEPELVDEEGYTWVRVGVRRRAG